jgi:hypothetical protein
MDWRAIATLVAAALTIRSDWRGDFWRVGNNPQTTSAVIWRGILAPFCRLLPPSADCAMRTLRCTCVRQGETRRFPALFPARMTSPVPSGAQRLCNVRSPAQADINEWSQVSTLSSNRNCWEVAPPWQFKMGAPGSSRCSDFLPCGHVMRQGARRGVRPRKRIIIKGQESVGTPRSRCEAEAGG